MKGVHVFIDSACNMQYASYYVFALLKIFNSYKVHFSSSRFKDLRHDENTFCLPFIVKECEARGGMKRAIV